MRLAIRAGTLLTFLILAVVLTASRLDSQTFGSVRGIVVDEPDTLT